MRVPTTAECIECQRVFDLLDEDDAGEWFYGHDCEVESDPDPADRKALDVWLRFIGNDEEAEAEANTFRDGDSYRVDWYLNSVGLVKSQWFASHEQATAWLEAEGFADFTS